jgi:tRNA U34 5-methylaminomethyl-2-thiouridine-forming methyltransferase MnmC
MRRDVWEENRMKHLLAAAACTPLLMACASAGAQTTNLADADTK